MSDQINYSILNRYLYKRVNVNEVVFMERAEFIKHCLGQNTKSFLWDEEPVFCITSDIDWASEAVMDRFFQDVLPMAARPMLFVTHHSRLIADKYKEGLIDRGVHPNFMPGSSHGDT
ncbi:MAG: hypothetical protein U1C33_05455, partial [Candidatus Cloacimonadaceae bacterium]|nr:hypothetical protein [Candidatus Cloacimonadaceae bacterium]